MRVRKDTDTVAVVDRALYLVRITKTLLAFTASLASLNSDRFGLLSRSVGREFARGWRGFSLTLVLRANSAFLSRWKRKDFVSMSVSLVHVHHGGVDRKGATES